MPFNRNNNNNNNNHSILNLLKDHSTTNKNTATSHKQNFDYLNENEFDLDDDDFYYAEELDEEEDLDDHEREEEEDEEDYFKNIINEVISDQIDSNNNNSSKKKQLFQQQQQDTTATTLTTTTQVVKVSEDDLIDQRESLRCIFKSDLLDRYDCRCDTNQGIFVTKQTKLSKSLQRKLANLYQLLHQFQLNLQSQQVVDLNNESLLTTENPTKIAMILTNSVQNQEYKKKLFRSMRSIVERVLIDALMICDQYYNQLQQQEQSQSTTSTSSSSTSNNSNSNSTTITTTTTTTTAANTTTNNNSNPTTKLWCEIRSRGCQFLGPQMQDDVLRLILHALDTVTRMSRKVLVLYVVHMLKKHYPKASKTSVGHVVQLLYRAGCFKVEKRENDSSLMELRKEFSKYQALRRQHDTQIIQIALESGIRMSPEQWSQKLFGDSNHKSEMQSIIDKLQSQQTLEKLINDFYDKLTTITSTSPNSLLSTFSTVNNNNGLDSLFVQIKCDFEYFAMINFEKKVAANPSQSSSTNDSFSTIGNSNNNNNSSNKRGDIGSGGESLTSEDDESSFADHDFTNLYDFDDFKSKLQQQQQQNQLQLQHQQQQQQQQQQLEQTKIVWTLLVDCMKRCVKILSCHIDYTHKMMSIIISNNSNNTRLNNNNNNKQFNRYDSLENSFSNSMQRNLVAMGPQVTLAAANSNRFMSSNNNNNNNTTTNNNKRNGFNQQSSFNSKSNNYSNNDFNSNNNNNSNIGIGKPPGFYHQQSNNIFDLNMDSNNKKNFNKVILFFIHYYILSRRNHVNKESEFS
jgi:hypothetical protein